MANAKINASLKKLQESELPEPINQDPKPVAEPATENAPPKKHFHQHVAAVKASAANIGKLTTELKKTGLNDKQTEIAGKLTAETVQLHLAVNNAVTAPDPEDATENTGGAANTDAVKPIDPNAAKA